MGGSSCDGSTGADLVSVSSVGRIAVEYRTVLLSVLSKSVASRLLTLNIFCASFISSAK